MARRRTFTPSPAQLKLLVEIHWLGGEDVPDAEISGNYHIATWVAVETRGFVSVDRGTEDGRGGSPWDYRYTLTDKGRESIEASGLQAWADATN